MGDFLCRSTPYLQGTTVCASVSTLTVVAFDRYLAICYPLKRFINRHRARIIIFGIWIFASILLTPWAVFYKISVSTLSDNVTVSINCFAKWYDNSLGEDYFLGVIFITCYVVPLILITGFYSGIALKLWRRVCSNEGICLMKRNGGINREKSIKAVKMLATVVALFAISWLPLYSSILVAFYLPQELFVKVPRIVPTLRDYVIPLSQLLGSANSCMNPWIYCLYSKNYRESFKSAILCRSVERARRITTMGCRSDFEVTPRKIDGSLESSRNQASPNRVKSRQETKF